MFVDVGVVGVRQGAAWRGGIPGERRGRAYRLPDGGAERLNFGGNRLSVMSALSLSLQYAKIHRDYCMDEWMADNTK